MRYFWTSTLFLVWAFSAQAQSFYPPASQAMGEAGRASIESVDAHFLNPAALALAKNQWEFAGVFRSAQPGTESPTLQQGFVVVDNSPETVVAAGLSYLYTRKSYPDHQPIDHEWALSVASQVLEKLFVGGTAKRVARGDFNGRGFTKYNYSLGFLLTPLEFFGLAFVANDIGPDDDLDFVPQLSAGVHFNVMDVFRIKADISRLEKRNPDKKGKLGMGLEFPAGEGFFLRGGGIWDGLNGQNYWTAGLGWGGPKLCLDYAFKSNPNVSGDAAHTFDLRLIF